MNRLQTWPTRTQEGVHSQKTASLGKSRLSPQQNGLAKAIRSRLKIRTRLRSVVRRIWPPAPKPLILMYHRIADQPIDPWGLAVSAICFEEQLRVLRDTRRSLPLADFVRGLINGTLAPNAVALTFDDGYVDNLVTGKPLLSAADIPATVFLTTGYVDRNEGFWWDELAKIIFLGDSHQNFELVIHDKSVQFDFGTGAAARADGKTPVASLKRRRAVLESLRQTLLVLNDEERGRIMAKLRAIFAERDYRANSGRVLTSDEVRAIASDGLVTIGAHTVTHPALARLGAIDRQREVTESKRTCEDLIGAPVTAFAYPYGDFDAETRETVRSVGFSSACSMQSGSAIPTSDVFALPRIHVPNLNGDEFERTLRSVSATG